MMKTTCAMMLAVLLAATWATAQDDAAPAAAETAPASADPNATADSNDAADPSPSADPSAGELKFEQATHAMRQKLEQSRQELNALRAEIADKKIPLAKELSRVEARLIDVRREYQNKTRVRDTRALSVSNLKSEIDAREKEASFLSNSLLSEYIRNLETRLHIAEVQRYDDVIEAALNASSNDNLTQFEVIEAQTKVLSKSLDRIEGALGGLRFSGTAVDPEGVIRNGKFLQIGPSVLFRSVDGQYVGTAESRRGSDEPTIVTFEDAEDANAASAVVEGTGEMYPLDPTLGNAHVIAETEDTLWEHIQKGGPVMVPIGALAGSALLVALYKWLALVSVKRPSNRRVKEMLQAVEQQDKQAAIQAAKSVGGPAGRMLAAGAENLEMPRELVEEVMYEQVLSTRLKLQRMLPFVAITAASAPLLGLLGTVIGIIDTFKMITVFGAGDVKALSGGISEALITTEFGLIVAIPSLLLHAFLSRKARGMVDEMEKAAVSLVNQLGKTPYRPVENAA